MTSLTAVHELCGCPGAFLRRQAVGAVRRRSRASEHRARMHRPACRQGGPGGHRRPCRRTRRDPELSPDRRRTPRASPTGSPRRASTAGDRVAIMLEPSRAFYTAVFGTMKLGAIARAAVHAVRTRRRKAARRRLFAGAAGDQYREGGAPVIDRRPRVVMADADFMASLARFPSRFEPATRPMRWRSSSTRRGRRASCRKPSSTPTAPIVTLMVAALYGTGLRPGDRTSSARPRRRGATACGTAPGAARVGPHDRRLCRQVRRRAAAEGAAGSPLHQHLRSGDPLSHDAEFGRRAALSIRPARSCPSPASRSTARRRPSPRRRSAVRSAACTAPPRSA